MLRLTARSARRLLCPALASFLVSIASAEAQELFKTPEDAASALVSAARDNNLQRLYSILGANGPKIASSGDRVLDAADRQRFASAYDSRHSINQQGNSATLLIGQDDFPFAIPLVRAFGHWKFDTRVGYREITLRRLGRNELNAIQTSLAFIDAQQDYAAKDRGQGAGTYAQRIVSSEKAKDGLYWEAAPGEEESPLGRLAADAAAEGYRTSQRPQPFHGYFYKVLKRQGSAAPGGAIDYIVGGKMIGGFALLAYPAEYGRSGVMSFITSHAGTIYQKDLGPGTRYTAARMTRFDPGRGWDKVSPDDLKPADVGTAGNRP
ncbi:hypothetical protein ASE66_09145 [Bosea sp. Root483D1]|uniref:DUF2950 domain-containing protein n=1 Tax=Bosea sp. Root483D1 TaxID=1736544 RepID=UPI000709CBE1|nr:DUF2950 domain-containing protein [Bosea sp. Root483D1]KRE16768.1 hypothetical protein ASE66_09145 [Bosea sp. Root483D1]